MGRGAIASTTVGTRGNAPPRGTGRSRGRLGHKDKCRGFSDGWQSRQFPAQIIGVFRHTERADCMSALYHGGPWSLTEDFKVWPTDPPLSDAGRRAAGELGRLVQGYAAESGAPIHVVITSPYTRCVETAAEICRALGRDARLIVDLLLGEVFGPDIMGISKPARPVRPRETIHAACRSSGVTCVPKALGKWPAWPEDLRTARQRFGERFVTYLQRSTVARRSFVMVTHEDAVGMAASLMPSFADQVVAQVDYGGGFFARRTHTAHDVGSLGKVSEARSESPPATRLGGSRHSPASQQAAGDVAGSSPTGPGPSPPPRGPGEGELPPQAPVAQDDLSSTWLDELDTCDFEQCVPRGEVLWMLEQESADPGSPPFPRSVSCGHDVWKERRPLSASCGWEVRMHSIQFYRKARKASLLNASMETFTRNSHFTRRQIERLLGEMPSHPLGDSSHDPDKDGSGSGSLSPSGSLSTILFGESEVASCVDQLSQADAFSRQVSGQSNAPVEGEDRTPTRTRAPLDEPAHVRDRAVLPAAAAGGQCATGYPEKTTPGEHAAPPPSRGGTPHAPTKLEQRAVTDGGPPIQRTPFSDYSGSTLMQRRAARAASRGSSVQPS